MSYIRQHAKTGNWHFRMRVPLGAQGFLNKKVMSPSMGTKKKKEALELVPEYLKRANREIELALQGKRMVDLTKIASIDDLTEDQRQQLDAITSWASRRQVTGLPQDRMALMGDYYALKNMSHSLYDILLGYGILIEPGSSIDLYYSKRDREEAMRTVAWSEQQRIIHKAESIDVENLSKFEDTIIQRRAQSVPPLMTVMELFAEFKELKLTENTDEERKRFEHIASNFASYVGRNTAVNHVTRKQVIKFFNLLANYPPRLTIDQRSMSFTEITAATHKKTISETTSKEWYRRLFRLYAHAVNAHSDTHTVTNIFDGMASETKGRSAVIKREWYDYEIAELFDQPEFKVRDSFFWSVVCAIHHGNRLSEFHRRKISELVQDKDGIWYIDVVEGKTASSTRKVPIHKCVLDLGFLDFVDQSRKAGSEYIFPDVDHEDPDSDAFSKDFGRFLNRCGLYNPARTLHNFRNTFITCAHRSGIQGVLDAELAVMKITGHTPETIHKKKYLNIYVDTMKLTIDQVKIDGFPYASIK